jgi:hypothetical protein
MECSRTVSNYGGPQFRDARMAWMDYLGRPSWTEDLAAGEILAAGFISWPRGARWATRGGAGAGIGLGRRGGAGERGGSWEDDGHAGSLLGSQWRWWGVQVLFVYGWMDRD